MGIHGFGYNAVPKWQPVRQYPRPRGQHWNKPRWR